MKQNRAKMKQNRAKMKQNFCQKPKEVNPKFHPHWVPNNFRLEFQTTTRERVLERRGGRGGVGNIKTNPGDPKGSGESISYPALLKNIK